MIATISFASFLLFFLVCFAAWRMYLRAAADSSGSLDTGDFSLTEVFDDNSLVNIPHQRGIRWLHEVFSRSAKRFPDLVALQIPQSGESLTFAELDARAEDIAAALSLFLDGPDQIVAVAMPQESWHIVAAHLGTLKAGGVMMFLDTSLPTALQEHMLIDAKPVVVLTRGQEKFRELPTLDVSNLPECPPRQTRPAWLDDPTQRLASIFYTSGTTGLPKGVECAHAGYVNLALSYADYFDLIPGMDATTLTSSLGYDGSISEMYSAWVSGCSVVLLTKEQTRSGPDLVNILREAEVTVLFCPPVLLTTLTSTPAIDLPYPICRYIVPAGEAFPAALVEPWTRNMRQIINTYGPTEASTDTSRQSLRPGEPVTIGSPMANVTYVILKEGRDRPLPHGEAGELCIGGVHLARGYRNLPELTAEKFIEHPEFGRLYRTGDKCRIDGVTHRVHFLGRIDTQLKVRGHRVEVQAVEDILQSQFAEIESAVLDYQNEELIAFVSAPSMVSGESQNAVLPPPEWASQVTSRLAARLPEPSVPTRVFLVESFVMKPLSGKIDRESLPRLADLLSFADKNDKDDTGPGLTVEPGRDSAGEETHRSGMQTSNDCAEVLAVCKGLFETPIGPDDVFADNGGHSIVMAQLAQRLQAAGWPVSVRALLSDCDTARKVADIPREKHQVHEIPVSAREPDTAETGRDEAAAKVLPVWLFTSLQVLFLLLLFSPHLLGFLSVVAFAEIGEVFMTATVWEFIAIGFLLYLAALSLPFADLLWVMIIKILMGGHPYRNRVTPGVYAKWSRMHLRVWCIGKLENSVIIPLGAMFRSAPLMAYVMRRLGATVGDNLQCAYDAQFSGPLDLLSIGDDVAIQTGAYVHMTRWNQQQLHIGAVRLENRSKIGMRSAIAGGATIGEGSWIQPFTPILGAVGSNQVWEGSPARMSGHCSDLRRTADYCVTRQPAWFMESINVVMQIFLDFWLVVAPAAAVTWFATKFLPGRDTDVASEYFKLTPVTEIMWQMSLYTFVTTWVTAIILALLACIFLRMTRYSPGLYSSRGFRGSLLLYRVKKLNQLQNQWTWTVTGQYLRALAGMKFSRVGGSECDVMFNLVPELASADAQIFWSNGSFTNMLDYGFEHIKLRRFDMPRNFFSGNNSVAEYGQFPSNFLLGVSTPGSDVRYRRQMRSRLGEPVTVAGNPPVRFASADFELENQDQKLPGLPLFMTRVFLNDLFSIGLLRVPNIIAFVLVYVGLLRLEGNVLVSAFLALILSELILILICATLKKVLVGKHWGTDHSTPFWSMRHLTYFFSQDCFFAWCRPVLGLTAGTVLANNVLRLMGCTIGKRTIIGSPMQASDWNAVSFGDDCMINGFLQYHTFENMVMKVKRTEIGDGSTVSFGATVMGGASIDRDSNISPLSMVLKEMHLPSASYHGSPVEMDSSQLLTRP